ncbi:hypothetical protein SS50377_22721 [Spironucleus salmonicida]|uniref:Uncharacterized protein n=1 Tax=Spironucleus salmonicida TaxID=348837 RepID=V6LIQ6_9EUKA|nr:hypothetical protein SS50377_22721 [Spironucleus salmonicida]|eukprot:EST44198.1 Hypothetical protein SS50377_16004 [Spironucleus salmonicida]
MIIILTVSCYYPNATFIYNPITNTGLLEATFLPSSNTAGYKVCEEIDNHLSQAVIELSDQLEAVSINFIYKVRENIQIQIDFPSSELQQAALDTSQSNFKIVLIDMDAEIKQTLSYFSLLSYNSGDCLSNIVAEIQMDQIIIKAKQNGCNYSITRFVADSAISNIEKNTSIIVELSLFNLVLRQYIGLQIAEINDDIDLTFDCKNLGQSCYNIIKNLTDSSLIQFSLTIYYQLNEPKDQYFIVVSQIKNILDPTRLNCYDGSHVEINNGVLVLFFEPNGNCQFDNSRIDILIGIQDDSDPDIANTFVYEYTHTSFSEQTAKVSIECKNINLAG